MGRSIDPDIGFLNISECLLEVIEKTPSEDLIQSYIEVYGNLDEQGNQMQMSAEDYQLEMFDILGLELDNIEVTLVDEIEALDEFMFGHTNIWNSPTAVRVDDPDVDVDDMMEREMALICQEEFMDHSVSNLTVTVSSNNNLEVGTSSRRRRHEYNNSASSDDEDLELPYKIPKIDLEELCAPDKNGLAEFLGTFMKLGMVREKKPTTTIHYPAASNVYYVNPRIMKRY